MQDEEIVLCNEPEYARFDVLKDGILMLENISLFQLTHVRLQILTGRFTGYTIKVSPCSYHLFHQDYNIKDYSVVIGDDGELKTKFFPEKNHGYCHVIPDCEAGCERLELVMLFRKIQEGYGL